MDVREKLVELLKQTEINKINGHTALAETCFTPNVFENMANNLVANGVTVQRWIPVTERLPEIYEKEPDWSVTVLFMTTQGHIHSGYRNIGRPQRSFYDDAWTPPYWLDESEQLSFEEDEITHWMPLPEPPKEDAE